MEGESSTGPMSDMPVEQLTDTDRMLIREARDEINRSPTPVNRGPMGCLTGLMGLVTLIAWPSVSELIPGADFVSPFVVLGGILMLIGGLVASFFGGSSGRLAAEAAVESAARHLQAAESDRETRLRAATLLIMHAFISSGPATTQTFEPIEMQRRIGASMPLVLAVEGYLLSDEKGWSVFSDLKVPE